MAYSSIFGNITASKFIYSGSTYNLNYIAWEPNYENDIIEHTSVANGKKEFILNGKYAEFTINMNLYKYESSAKSKFIELYNIFINEYEVEFYPFSDAPSIKDKNGNIVYFRMIDCTPYFVDNTKRKDGLKLVFASIDYVDLSKSLI